MRPDLIPLLVVLVIVAGLPVAWFISELYSSGRRLRCTLGVLAILASFGVAWLAAQLVQFDYNARYGFSAKAPIDVIVEKTEAGKHDVVRNELKRLQRHFRPTYEMDANFDVLVNEAVQRMKVGNTATRGASRGSL